MKKLTKPIMAAALTVSVLGLTACTQSPAASFPDTIQIQNVENQVITVQSTEEIKVVPDMAQIVFAVTTQAQDAKACQEANNKDLTNVINFLKDYGMEETSIQTSDYGLNPIYDWNSGQTITGYEMRTTLTLSDLPMDQVGSLLSACVEHGINSIERITYLSSKYDESYQEALKQAIASARTKAEVMAQASGRTLGDVSHVEEYSANEQAKYTGYRNAAATEAAIMDQVAVEPGQISVEARVSVDFRLQ